MNLNQTPNSLARAAMLLLLAITLGAGCSKKAKQPTPNEKTPEFKAHQDGKPPTPVKDDAKAKTDALTQKQGPNSGLTAPVAKHPDATVITVKASKCREYDRCKKFGQCAGPGKTDSKDECAPETDLDCLASEACQKNGLCRVRNGQCVKESEARAYCARQYACRRNKTHCEPVDGKCTNLPGFECRDKTICANSGRCTSLVEQRCRDEKTCSPAFVRCGATKDEDCLASNLCKRTGRCKAGDEVIPSCKCYATEEELKADPLACASSARKNICVLTDAGCKQSKACTQRGACKARITCGGARCASVTDSDCASSEGCKKFGRCGILPISSFYRCGPTKPAHCKESTMCKEKGLCSLGEATCTK